MRKLSRCRKASNLSIMAARIRRQACMQFLASRRGVASVLAMMMAILVGALAVAMGTVTQGNLRNASTNLHVMRAMQASETGLEIAKQRLEEAAARFIVEKGEIDQGFGTRLWLGATSFSDGQIIVLPPRTGFSEGTYPSGIAQAVANRHAVDQNTIEVDGIDSVVIGPAPAGTDLGEYIGEGWVTTPAIALRDSTGGDDMPTAFQITYAPLANGVDVRIFSTGYDFDPTRPGRALTRVISEDVRIAKNVDSAVVSQSRILIGKNVHIEGDIGTRFDQVEVENGNPMVIRSDFAGLDPILDTQMVDLYNNLALHDVDGDNRLRVGHPIEQAGLNVDGDPNGDPLSDVDYDGDGLPDGAFTDITGDGYVDEFDLFIAFFDSNGDGRVAIAGWPAVGTPAEFDTPEFIGSDGLPVDSDLAYLIDSSLPDRNLNGISGFVDSNGDGVWQPAIEPGADYDYDNGTWADQVLGYRDGYIDYKDQYVKVDGHLVFLAAAEQWAASQGDIFDAVHGSIRPGTGDSPLEFDASIDLLPDVTADSFTDTQNALYAAADGGTFWSQVAQNLGISEPALVGYIEPGLDPSAPQYYRLDPDTDGDGLPDNYASAYWERMPFNSPTQADWYYRPVFKNMVFKDVVIPEGLNGLFENCTMVGVTRIESYTDNTHVNWSLYGALESDGVSPPTPKTDPLDKSDFDRYTTGVVADGPSNYDDFPDPPIIYGTVKTGADRDTKRYSNNVRFHDCLFVGSLIADVPDNYTHLRNKIQLTGATRFTDVHPDEPNNAQLNPEPDDLAEIAKSSMMAPNYSVDIGTFNSPPQQNVQLKGAIIAGVLDVRGNASINGALLLTFSPQPGEGPLVDSFGVPLGNPADFNTSIGYFGPDDGDSESLDPETLPIENGVKIVGWDLNGDGLADLGPDTPPTPEQRAAGATGVPFYGYGRIDLKFDPDLVMPDGLMLPLSTSELPDTYREGIRR
ncbi:MAG TPA: hypothetical protein ENJ00_00740 [Phycisphaerales bacterium]|nr:hypothetical protein [Phycisphaerales bacterium]